MIRRKKALLLSSIVILLCMCLIIGGTFAIFTDSETVENHLQAGNLDLVLERTNLDYCVLNGDGNMQEYHNTTLVDFSTVDSAKKNVFGLTDEILIVPGSYFNADLQLKNGGNVAFNYTISVKLDSESDPALAEQLNVEIVIYEADGTTVKETRELLVSEMENGVTINQGNAKKNAIVKFDVNVTFLDDRTTDGIVNNDAKAQAAGFDLFVVAEQDTTVVK